MMRAIMSNRLPCSRCGVTRDIEIIERVEQVTIKGREVSFNAHYSRCLTCGDEFEAPGQLDANLDAAREAYARLYEAPSPEALVSLRARYNASQKAFGAILGFGELTMNGYESGGTPDSTNRLLLKLAADPLIFKAMYDINSSKIGMTQRRRIEESPGYKTASSWDGLEALSRELTELQRAKVEECATRAGRTIPEQVARYVGDSSFRDYSRLMEGIRWSTGVAQVIDMKPEAPAPLSVAS
jgi:putative zinc finger/helix-turn-helix YgiT family protein